MAVLWRLLVPLLITSGANPIRKAGQHRNGEAMWVVIVLLPGHHHPPDHHESYESMTSSTPRIDPGSVVKSHMMNTQVMITKHLGMFIYQILKDVLR